MAMLSLGVIITICAAVLFTILLILLYCCCRTKNKIYDHTCTALLHRDVERGVETYIPSQDIKKNRKKETVVHLRGYTSESAPIDTKLKGQNTGKEKRNSTELKYDVKEKRSSKKFAKKDEKRSSKKEKKNEYTKVSRDPRKEDNNKNIEIKNAEKLKKRGSKKELKPYEVKVELRNEEPLESSPVSLFRQTSGQYPEKCPLSIDEQGIKNTLQKSQRDSIRSSQDTRPARDTGNPHYLRPNSIEEKTLTAEERREKYSRSHSDSVFKHSKDDTDSSHYLRPRSFDEQDGRPINEDHYVRPRSVGREDWDEKRRRESQRSSSYYVAPRAIETEEREKRERDSHYVRPKSFEESEREKRDGKRRESERLSSYYINPRAVEDEASREQESYYVRPRSFEENERVDRIRRDSEKLSSYYMSPRLLDMEENERNKRDSYYVTPRTLEREERKEKKERERSDRESYYKRSRSMDDGIDERASSYYVSPRSFERDDTRDRDSYYVHPRTLEKGEQKMKDRESHYDTPRSFDNEDGRESYYVQPRTLEKDRYYTERRGDRRYASTQNVRPYSTGYRERRPRSADRAERHDRGQRSSSYMTPRTLEMEKKDRYRRERDDSREKSGDRQRGERSGERERREKSRERERRDEQTGTRREERTDRRRRSEERYRMEGKDGRTERDMKDVRDGKDKGTERDGREVKDRRDGRERSTERERNEERNRRDGRERERNDERGRQSSRERSDERERKDERYRKDGRERSTERKEKERKDERDHIERRSRREGRREREERGRTSKEKQDYRTWSPKRPLPEDRRPRPRARSHSLEHPVPSSMERKKRQMHVIQRTKSWASRPSQRQRAESPSLPPRTIQLEFHPLSGDVTPLDTKSEASTEPHSINVIENVQLESSPVLDFEKPAKRSQDEAHKNWLSSQNDSRRSSATPTNDDRKDSSKFQTDTNRSSSQVKDESRNSWHTSQNDSKRSSATLTNDDRKDSFDFQSDPRISAMATNHSKDEDHNSRQNLQSDLRGFSATPTNEYKKDSSSFQSDSRRSETPNTLQSDSRRSSATITNGDRKDLMSFQSDSRRSATPNTLQSDSRRSSVTVTNSVNYSETDGERRDYRPSLDNDGDQTILSGSLVIEYAADKRTKTRPRSADFSKPQETHADVSSKPQRNQINTSSKPQDTHAGFSSKPQGAQIDLYSNSSYDSQSSTDDYRVYQSEVRKLNGRARSTGPELSPKLVDDEAFTKPMDKRVSSERVIDLKTARSKPQGAQIDLFSNSSYDSQSSTDDYRVYQSEVRKLNNRARSAGPELSPKLVDDEVFTKPMDKRVSSERVIDLKTVRSKAQATKRTPRSSISSEDVDWHLFTIDGKKILKSQEPFEQQPTNESDVQHISNGLDWQLITLSGETIKRNIVTKDVTQSVDGSRTVTDQKESRNVLRSNAKQTSTLKEIRSSSVTHAPRISDETDNVFITQAPTVLRNESRSKGSMRASLESHLKNTEATQSRNVTVTKLQRSSSQPIIFNFE